MSQKSARIASWEKEYRRLCHKLSALGYISQGTILDRSALRRPRSGYQWTRKVAGKTVSVSLSEEQFQWLKKAIANRRKLDKILLQMERISRRILLETVPDTSRRKPLSRKVLDTI